MIHDIITIRPRTEEDIKLIEYLAKSLNVPYEIKKEKDERIQNKKPSDYFGTLSEEQGEKFRQYVQESREEWKRDI